MEPQDGSPSRPSFRELLLRYMLEGRGRDAWLDKSRNKYRRGCKWTKVELAEACGTDRRTVSYWYTERNNKLPEEYYNKLESLFLSAESEELERVEFRRALEIAVSERDGKEHQQEIEESRLELDGEWLSFYVERDLFGDPYCVQEAVRVIQNGSKVNGTYECITYEYPDFSFEGKIHGKILTGTYLCPVRGKTEYGRGMFQLMAYRGDEWLEGYATWFDMDTKKIECSKHIWFRDTSTFSGIFHTDVKRIMESEIKHQKEGRQP